MFKKFLMKKFIPALTTYSLFLMLTSYSGVNATNVNKNVSNSKTKVVDELEFIPNFELDVIIDDLQ